MRRALGNLEENAGGGARHTDTLRARSDVRPAERHGGERPRARFVQDGDVPVTILSRSRPHEADGAGTQTSSRLSVAETALANERMARARAERALAEAQTAVHDLETKWRHAELARHEIAARAQADKAALEAELAGLRERETDLAQQLDAERAARAKAELNSRQDNRLQRTGRRAAATLNEQPVVTAKVKPAKRASRPVGPKQREPKPVKWWLNSAKKP